MSILTLSKKQRSQRYSDSPFVVTESAISKSGWVKNGLIVILAYLLLAMPQLALAEGPVSQPQPIMIPYITPDRIVIPAIDLDSPIISVGSQIKSQNGQRYREWNTADNVVGWHNLSARIGHRGNTVLAGHSDIYTQVFQNLHQVEAGDEITVYSDNYSRQYIVTDIRELREKGVSLAQRIENGKLISRTKDERITLITCSRPGASHRLVVIARPIDEQSQIGSHFHVY